jgi:hypothetical protein
MMDYFRIPLSSFFVMALVLCAVTPVCLFWSPVIHFGLVYFYGPYVALLLWLTVIELGVRVYRRHGLWLLATALVIRPATYIHAVLVVGCALTGNCL